jgi:hypothetical protein
MSSNKQVVNDLPFAIGSDVLERLSRYDRSDFAADYAIGNQPWLSHATDEKMISRVTTQYQKERVDQEAAAGENSLSNWWLRSATSWHRGEGAEFYDADTEDIHRFRESANVDVWTQGEVSLLPDTDLVTSSHGGSSAVTCSLGAWFVSGGRVYLYTASTDVLAEVAGSYSTAQKVATDGCSALVASADGIYQITSALVVSKLYDAPGGAWTVQALGFVKSRIIVGCSITDALPMRVFELGRTPASAPASIDLNVTTGDSRFEYASTALSFTDIAEATSAILVATNTGIQSRVISFGIDTSVAGLATMLEPINVAEFPVGEVVRALRSYLNMFIVAATSRGVRVGQETANGLGFVYGPLTIKDDVTDLSFDGEYVYATRSVIRAGQRGLWRLDLGSPVGASYAYASDIPVAAGVPASLCMVGTTGKSLILTADAVYIEDPDSRVASGYLDSGWVRFGTTESKQPVSFSLRSRNDVGILGVRVIDRDLTTASFDSVPISKVLNIPLSQDLSPSIEFEVRLTLASEGADGPVLDEWQLRALPAPLRSRTITLPLMCFSEERDAHGVTRNSDAWTRLRQLESLEQSGGSCLFQDFSTGEERTCVIRAVQFEQSTPPSFENGFGGTVTVQLQTVDVELL